jgi:hypothetical protein
LMDPGIVRPLQWKEVEDIRYAVLLRHQASLP